MVLTTKTHIQWGRKYPTIAQLAATRRKSPSQVVEQPRIRFSTPNQYLSPRKLLLPKQHPNSAVAMMAVFHLMALSFPVILILFLLLYLQTRNTLHQPFRLTGNQRKLPPPKPPQSLTFRPQTQPKPQPCPQNLELLSLVRQPFPESRSSTISPTMPALVSLRQPTTLIYLPPLTKPLPFLQAVPLLNR